MATITIGPFRPYKTFSGGPPFRMALPEVASSTFKTGAVIIAGAAGKMAEAGTDPTRILGVAEEPGENITSPAATDKTHFAVANKDTLFVGNVSTAQVTALTDVGASYGITKVGDNWTIDKSKVGTSRRVIIIDLDLRDAVADIQGRLLFQFLDPFTGFNYTS